MLLDLPHDMMIKRLRAYRKTLCYYSKGEVSRSLRTLDKFKASDTPTLGLSGLRSWADQVEENQWQELMRIEL